MSLKLVEVEFRVWPFVKAAKRAFWVSERVQNRSGCDRVKGTQTSGTFGVGD